MINNHTKFSAIVHYKQFGGTVRKIAKRYGVSKSSVDRASVCCLQLACPRINCKLLYIHR